MAQFSNSSILAAVLTKWAQPALKQLTSERLDSLPWLNSISNKVKSTGWVSQNWSLGKEVAPLLGEMTEAIVAPIIERYLQGLPDNAVPQVAHTFVDNAIKNGGLILFDGNVVFEVEDLKELKGYLNWNLPLDKSSVYEVKVNGGETNN